jgi:glycosyltransferase involved in cell wall biosynthesis
MSILISIVVPCYNQAQYLEECLESVINQTYQNWECIIVNDGSPDNTEDVALPICAKDSRIKYLKINNAGVSHARNTGIKISEGEYILPLDADDIIGDTYIEKAIEVFASNQEVSLVYCSARKFGDVNEIWDLSDYSYKDLLMDNMIFCSAFFRKSDWQNIGGYDEHIAGFEDWEFWVRLLNEKSVVYSIPQVLFYYRIKEISRQKTVEKNNYDAVHWYLFEKNIDKYKRYYASPLSIYLENKKNENIMNSHSYKIGNKIVRFLKIFTTSKKV